LSLKGKQSFRQIHLDNKEKKLREQMAGTGVDVGRNPDGSVQLIMPGSITFDTNKSNIKPNFYGGASGLYLDNKEKKLREQMAGTGVDVGRNPDGSVQLIMPGSITFDTNKSNIKPNFYGTLNKVAQTLAEDNKSAILVTGYTDNTGNDSINIPLSQARAQSVKNYLSSQGVSSSRIDAQGLGSSNPIASNATAAGKEQNRRVEISIYAKQ
jgi:outer membrane protein OmpA-like peptidoglycan-associated protein